MAIQFSEFLGNVNNGIYSMPIFCTILSSVVYTSIVLSILVIIMMIFTCPTDNIPTVAFGKMFVYLLIVNTLVFSAHYSIMANKQSEKTTNRTNNDFITNINRRGGAYDKDSIKVIPNFKPHETFPNDLCDDVVVDRVSEDTSNLTIDDVLSRVEKTL